MIEKPSITDVILGRISSHLGASAETLHKVKFGRGTVGKVALVAIFAIAAIGVSTYRLDGEVAIFGIGAVVVVTLSVLGLILYIVIERPELAVLEGMELVQYKQITLGAKNMPPSIDDTANIVGPVAMAQQPDNKQGTNEQ